jgi:hypothetical protein
MSASRFGVPAVLAALVGGAALWPATSQTRLESPPVRTVLELFTSQGCSSCPPADRLLGSLVNDPSVIALSMPIDYWDYLGWRDTLADPAHTRRQKAYAAGRGDRQVYTPQMIVNGLAHANGADRASIERAAATTRRDGVGTVPVRIEPSGAEVAVTLGASSVRGEVWVLGVRRVAEVAIGRGENRGASVAYHHVVRRWVRAGDYAGETVAFRVPVSELGPEADMVAVLVQAPRGNGPGPMLGAELRALR